MKWNDVQKGFVEKYLDGSMKICGKVENHINKELHSANVVRALFIEYPEPEKVVGDHYLKTDMTHMARIRQRMAAVITSSYNPINGEIPKGMKLYVEQYLLYKWGDILNGYLSTLEKNFSKIQKVAKFL